MPENQSREELKQRVEGLERRIRAAEKSEFFLQKSQEMGKLGHFSYDPETGIVEGSSELFKIFGVDPHHPLSNAFYKAVHPEDQHLIFPFIDRAVKKGVPFDVEHRVRHRNGDILWVHAKGELIETPEGNRLVGAVQDITESVLAQADLAQIFAMSLDLICIADIETATFIKVNPAFTIVLGYTETELLEKPFLDFIHPEDVDKTRHTVEKKLRSGAKVVNFENRYRCKNGDYRWLSWVSHPIPEKGRTYAMARDITGYKAFQAEQAEIQQELIQRNRFIEAILDYLPIGLGVNTIDSGEVSYLNKKFEEIYGWPKADFPTVAQFFDKVFPDPKEREALREKIIGDMASGDPERMAWEDLEITTKAGEKRIVFAKNIPIPDQNLMISTVQDFTEKRKLEEQVRQAQRMESIGRLAGGVAHDSNNMLSIISGNAEIALEEVGDDTPVASHLREIQKAAKRSADLTRQLLAFARKQTVSPQTLDLNKTIDRMLKMLQRLIGERIDLVWRPKTGLWAVRVDPTQIDQVLANLCVNARDAIEDIGNITIETDNVVFEDDYCRDHDGFKPGRYVMLAVSDNGCGMGTEILNHIFEPFYTTKHLGQGTGLGLATVYGIVKQNDGFITVYSEPGNGTTMKLYFPRFDPLSEPVQGIPVVDAAVGGTETILLVEDDTAILNVSKKMLERLGYNVFSASNPVHAIHIATKYPGEIHLLITDVIMPIMNGRDLALKLLPLHPEMKCLYMSGYTANVISHHGVLDEGIQFINKPFSKRELALKIRKTMDQGKTLDS